MNMEIVMATYFVVQTFQQGNKGMLIPDQARQARDLNHCKILAERMAKTSASVVAFSRNGDPTTGEWDDAVVVAKHGDVPAELLEMAAG